MIRNAILWASLIVGASLAPARADTASQTKTSARAKVQVVTLAAQPIVFRVVTASPEKLEAEMRSAFLGLVGSASAAGLSIVGSPIVRYRHRADADDQMFEVEAALPVKTAPAKPRGLEVGTLPAGSAVTVEHRGKLADLPLAHAALDAWLVANKRMANGLRWEIFMTNPVTTPDPAAQVVRVIVPLAPVR